MKLYKIILSIIITFSFCLVTLQPAMAGPDLSDSKDFLDKAATKAGVDTSGSKDENSLAKRIGNIVNIFLSFVSVIATIFILYGSFVWITAGGNEEKVRAAKKHIINAAIGIVIASLSYMIVNLAINLSTPTKEGQTPSSKTAGS